MYRGNALKEAVRIIREYQEKKAPVWVDSGMYSAFVTRAGSPCFDEKIYLDNETELKKLRAATGKYTGQQMDREKYIEIRTSLPNESFIYDPGDNSDVFVALSLADVMVSTDCSEFRPGEGHPQVAATYPYFFRMMVKETQQFMLLEAVKRCTLLPAQAADLAGKGRIACGMDADLVVLDWERLHEHADFSDPGAPPSGVRYVFVNGVLSIQDEKRIAAANAGYCIKR
jgi:N-acyl-D-amino-acid deacylase